MTALDEYARLECDGLWRSAPDDRRREVGLSFGTATLVIVDAADRPLAHWSLPAIRRLNGRDHPALYSPDADATETLEISDETMIDALDRIRRGIERTRPRSGRLRLVTTTALLAGLAALAILWLPGALVRQTLSVVPPVKRAEIGATLLGHVQRLTGPTCRDPLGTAALATLSARILGADSAERVLVVPRGLAAPVYLPGGIVLLPRDRIERTDDAAVVAGDILATSLGRTEIDPLEPILRDAGLGTVLRLLTTGDIPTDILRSHAEAVVTTPPVPADATTIAEGFGQAGIPVAPWAATLPQTDPRRATLLAIAETAPGDALLGDGTWVSLQGICQA